MSLITKKLTSDFWPSDVLDIIKKYLLCPKIIAAYGGYIKIWSFGKLEQKIGAHYSIDALVLSPNKKYIASGGSSHVKITDYFTGGYEHLFQNEIEVKFLAWCPKSQYIASASSNSVFIWNVIDGAKSQSILAYRRVGWEHYHPEKHNVHSISWSPNGEQIVTSNLQETVKIFNVKTGICEKTFSHILSRIPFNLVLVKKNVEWSSNYTKIASSIEGRNIGIWDTISDECVNILKHPSLVITFSWSPNGTHIVSCCDNSCNCKYYYNCNYYCDNSCKNSCKIFVWNTVSGICEMILNNSHKINSVVWSSDGKYIVSSTGTKVKFMDGVSRTGEKIEVWDALSGELLHEIPASYGCHFISVEQIFYKK